ncbi:MAG TPA: Ig-like domain-containing protein [Acidothermaceae bacterium]|nr:Ig-like domain-containing protein [Acidothermaceae bacterium]
MATTIQLTATPKDSGGTALTNRVVSWQSSNTAVATVNATGLVSAVAVGSCNITASCEGISSSAVPITVVNANTVSQIALTPPTASVQIGATLQESATPEDASGNPVSATITWTSSNTAVATVDATGLVTAVAAGAATITAAVGAVQSTSAITVPSNTTTRQMWLAADSLTSDTAGQSVGSWPDQAATPTITATQTTSANKPTFQPNMIGGEPVVEFAATDYLKYSDVDAVAWTRFFVVNVGSLSVPTASVFLAFGPASQISVRTDGSIQITLQFTDSSVVEYRTAAGAVTFGTACIIELAWDGSTVTNITTCKVNGTAFTMTNVGGTASGKTRKSEAGTTDLGGQTVTGNILGDLAEFVKVADAALHVDERDRLGTKYGITVI